VAFFPLPLRCVLSFSIVLSLLPSLTAIAFCLLLNLFPLCHHFLPSVEPLSPLPSHIFFPSIKAFSLSFC
jgi:hypothetical protein